MKNFTKKMIERFTKSRIVEITVDVINEAISFNRSLYTLDSCIELAITANRIQDIDVAFELASKINRFLKFSNEERNMFKRMTTESASVERSSLKRSNLNTQSARIDDAMTEFHTVRELVSLLSLSEARIISHKRHLERKFSNTVKLVIDEQNAKRFKFIKL